MTGFLLDTNVISELIKARPQPQVAAWIEAVDEGLLHLSVLTLVEIRKGIAAHPDAGRRAALNVWLEAELRPRFAGRILPIDASVADRWGLISGRAQASGKLLPVIDGLLAATALEHNLTFVTRNTKDVYQAGALVFNPWET